MANSLSMDDQNIIDKQPSWACIPNEFIEPISLHIAPKDWSFPSDHIPSILEICTSSTKLQIATWNVLNKMWMGADGMNGAFSLAHSKTNPRLTEREEHVLDCIFELANNGVSALCLQEVGLELAQAIQTSLRNTSGFSGQGFEIVTRRLGIGSDQEILLYDSSILEPLVSKNKRDEIELYRTGAAPHSLTDTTFKIISEPSAKIRVLNTHVPISTASWRPSPLNEFVEFIQKRKFEDDSIVVIAGDLNSSLHDVQQVMNDKLLTQFYIPRGGHRTHFNPRTGSAREIDSFVVRNTNIPGFNPRRLTDISPFCSKAASAFSILNPDRS